MGVLKIHCYKCGGRFSVNGGMVKHSEANVCPYCYTTLPREIWERIVLPAFGELEDANRELVKEHSGYVDVPLFQIGYVPSKAFKNDRNEGE
ncbi:MAG: hypothetical protein IJV74_00945 [Clostridia bacterium]|nr:hypothetical protein [Clostridia bacterium]